MVNRARPRARLEGRGTADNIPERISGHYARADLHQKTEDEHEHDLRRRLRLAARAAAELVDGITALVDRTSCSTYSRFSIGTVWQPA
jgi:hypothetical protein